MRQTQTFLLTAASLAAVFVWFARKSLQVIEPVDPADLYEDVMNNPTIDPVAAFLWMIRNCENLPSNVHDNSDYGVFYGGSRFVDFSNHPALTGEKKGVPLSDRMCRAAGFLPGCISTAAGAYQINVPTWRAVNAWGFGLPDFTPESQDEAARRLLEHDDIGAMIRAGDLEAAIFAASKRWASLPGSAYDQNAKSMEYALAKFREGMQIQGG